MTAGPFNTRRGAAAWAVAGGSAKAWAVVACFVAAFGTAGLAGAQAAAPAACSGTCIVAASGLPGYNPPVLVLASGSSVVWRSTDVGHTQVDGVLPIVGGSACFALPGPGRGDSEPARFDATADGLTVTIGNTTTACGTAQPLPDGAFGLGYYCALHGWMRGAIVVQRG